MAGSYLPQDTSCFWFWNVIYVYSEIRNIALPSVEFHYQIFLPAIKYWLIFKKSRSYDSVVVSDGLVLYLNMFFT